MCGIVGYISKKQKLYKPEKQHFMKYALMLDTLRGEDSTGVMTVANRFKVSTLKSTMPGDRFVQSKRYKEKSQIGWACVGHNRAATQGSVKVENAHPFVDGPITMVHNGTLVGKGRALPTFKEEFEVDSMQIAHALATAEPETEQIKRVLGKIHGSFALVWYDSRNETINMCRNDERPLHFGYNMTKDIMWFMSDGDHLNAINKSFYKSSAKANMIFKLDRLKLFQWKQGSIVPEVTPFDPFDYRWPRNNHHTGGQSGKKTTNSCGKSNSSSTALERATRKWRAQVGDIETQVDNPKTEVAGKNRKVPEPMLAALETEFGFDHGELLEFRPELGLEIDNNHMLVRGQAVLEPWGGVEWDAIVLNAKKLQWNAYRNYSWVVQPIGISHPVDKDSKSPSVLCHLIHCDWQGHLAEDGGPKEEDPEDQEDDKGESSGSSPVLVMGPQSEEIPYGELKPIMENGCVQCGDNLSLSGIKDCFWVNDGQDILCKSCNDDMMKQLVTSTTAARHLN